MVNLALSGEHQMKNCSDAKQSTETMQAHSAVSAVLVQSFSICPPTAGIDLA